VVRGLAAGAPDGDADGGRVGVVELAGIGGGA